MESREAAVVAVTYIHSSSSVSYTSHRWTFLHAKYDTDHILSFHETIQIEYEIYALATRIYSSEFFYENI